MVCSTSAQKLENYQRKLSTSSCTMIGHIATKTNDCILHYAFFYSENQQHSNGAHLAVVGSPHTPSSKGPSCTNIAQICSRSGSEGRPGGHIPRDLPQTKFLLNVVGQLGWKFSDMLVLRQKIAHLNTWPTKFCCWLAPFRDPSPSPNHSWFAGRLIT